MQFSIQYIYKLKDMMTNQMTAIRKSMGNVTKATAKASSSMKKLSKSMSNAGNSFSKSASKFTTAGNAISALGLGRIIIGVASSLVEYETRMNGVEAVTGSTKEEMKALRKTAIDMGKSTVFSVAQVAEAEFELGKAGLNAMEIIKAMPSVLNLAAAGELSMSEAAAITSKTLAQFNLDASEASRVADALAVAATSSNTDVRGLGAALAYVGNKASLAGLSIEDTAQMLALMAMKGIDSSSAGTSLVNMFSKLNNISEESMNALKRGGIDLSDYIDRAGNITNIFDLMTAIQGASLSAGELGDLLGIRGVRGLDAFRTTSFETMQTLDEAFANSEGAAERMALIMSQGLPGAVKFFQSAVDGLNKTMGEKGLTKALAKIIGLGTILINTISSMPAPFIVMINLGFGFIALLAVMSIVGLILGGVLSGLATTMKLFSAATREFTRDGRIVAKVLKVWTFLQWLLNAAMYANPLTLLVAAILIAIGIIVLLVTKFKKWAEVMNILNKPIVIFIRILKSLFAFWKFMFVIFVETIKLIWGVVGSFTGINIAVQLVISGFMKFIEAIVLLWDVVTMVFGFIKDVIVNTFNSIKDIVVEVIDWIKDKIITVLDLAGRIPGKVGDSARELKDQLASINDEVAKTEALSKKELKIANELTMEEKDRAGAITARIELTAADGTTTKITSADDPWGIFSVAGGTA